AMLVALGTTARADVQIAGGNGGPSDCFVEFKVTGTPTISTFRGKPLVECVDGSDCDADGQVNNSCTVALTPCALQSDASGCTAQGVTKFAGKSKRLFASSLPGITNATSATCASTSGSVVVKLKKRKRRGTVTYLSNQTTVQLIGKGPHGTKPDNNLFFVKC